MNRGERRDTIPSMKAPRGWRTIVVDDVMYLWAVLPGRDRFHDALRICIREAEPGVRAGEPVVRPRGPAIVIDTGIGSPDACNGPQCRQLLPPAPITPAQVAEHIRASRRS
jgi:hypothetical protein